MDKTIKAILPLMMFHYKQLKEPVHYFLLLQHLGDVTLSRTVATGAKRQMIHLTGHVIEVAPFQQELGLVATTR